MDLQSRIQALADTDDLVGLDDETREVLARQAVVRDFGPGALISADDERTDKLYVVVHGLVAVTSRSAHRRAPVTVTLGSGGLFGEDSLAGSGMQGATAYRRSRVLEIPSAAVLRIAHSQPVMADIVERLVELQRHAPWIIDHLRRSPLFENVPPSELYPLLEGATLVRGEPGAVVYQAHDVPGGFLMVLRGQVLLTQPGEISMGDQVLRGRPVTLGTGALFGDHAVVRAGPLLHHVEAGSDGCLLVRFPIASFRSQFTNSPSFQRGLYASPILEPGDRRTMRLTHIGADLRVGSANWVGLVSDRPGLPLERLTDWLAQAAAEEWGDRVVVLHLDPDAPAGPPTPERVVRQEHHLHASIHPSLNRIDAELVKVALDADTVFIDFGKVDPLAHPFWLERIRRTVYVATDAYRSFGGPLLDHLTRPLVYTAVVPSQPPDPGEVRIVPRGTVRIHRDLLAAARSTERLDDLPQALRVQVSRWMRAITERRVGIALGGGGALAYAHLALISHLEAQGIPVDMVAGVSGGSVIGAFYAAGQHLRPEGPVPAGLEGNPGLARLIELGGEFADVCGPAAVSSWVVSNWIDKKLGAVRLEDLLVPFFPVAVDIDQAVQVSIRSGPIGFGVRASGSFPGPFTPTTLDRRELSDWRPLPVLERGRPSPTPEPGDRNFYRYVDGGVLNNIPDDTLYLEGAQAVLASNVVPTPQPRSDTSAKAIRFSQAFFRKHSGRLPRFWRELEPMVRLDDILRAGYMMMHNPADWDARSADAKYQARTVGYTFPDWAHGLEIYQQQLSERQLPHVDAAIRQLSRRFHNMRWQLDEDMGSGALTSTIMARLSAE